MGNNMESIYSKLEVLGCNFAVTAEVNSIDPEKTILEALDYFWEDKKVFTMLVGLMKYKIYGLINTQRLSLLSQNTSEEKKALLAVLALKVFNETKDIRYKKIFNKFKICRLNRNNIPEKYLEKYNLEKKGHDKEFKKIKIQLVNFFNDQPARKFKNIIQILKSNSWLKYRALIGPEYRADLVYLKVTGQINNQKDAVDVIGCNKSSVSRLWKTLSFIDSELLTGL